MNPDDFDKAIQFVLRWEGGETHDTGGHTKYGISKRGHPDVDIPNLTIEKAKEIYKKEYWDQLELDKWVSFRWKLTLFDTAVNVGVSKVKYWLKSDSMFTWEDFLDKRIEWYLELAKSKKYSIYLRGWMNRVMDLKRYIKQARYER